MAKKAAPVITTSQPTQAQRMNGSLGVITEYNADRNVATVAITENDSDAIREILRNVPCPVISGTQQVAPGPGRLCWIVFKNGSMNYPLIVNYYNHEYEKYDYYKNNEVNFSVPSHLLD